MAVGDDSGGNTGGRSGCGGIILVTATSGSSSPRNHFNLAFPSTSAFPPVPPFVLPPTTYKGLEDRRYRAPS